MNYIKFYFVNVLAEMAALVYAILPLEVFEVVGGRLEEYRDRVYWRLFPQPRDGWRGGER
jgi:hypothetical protein